MRQDSWVFLLFFFNDTATTEIYTLSLHDALPILVRILAPEAPKGCPSAIAPPFGFSLSSSGSIPHSCTQDRKSTRLNSSHANISYAVFCLKKKKKPRSIIISRDSACTAKRSKPNT